MTTKNIEIEIAALVMLAAGGGGETQVKIPVEIMDKATRHIEAGHTLGYGRIESGELVVGWVFRKKPQPTRDDNPTSGV